MHPAYSVILFTTASGAGYGLLALLGLTVATPAELEGIMTRAAGWLLALALITAGLLASTFHLGHPERAWRALSQWRSSWLSREGVLALVTYLPALALGWWWLVEPQASAALLRWLGLTTALLCVLTVCATGMIYASLPTIRQWRQPLVVPVYLAFALASGALLLLLLSHLGGSPASTLQILALGSLLLVIALKATYWRAIDREPRDLDMAAATGLQGRGQVRQWEPAHTSENFVQQEMGYRVARRHAGKLRRLVMLALGLALLAVLVSALLPGPVATLLALAAVGATLFAAVMERWLFFAEAQHVVTLFYGAKRA